jgi:iron complex transport system ATP-binding protein
MALIDIQNARVIRGSNFVLDDFSLKISENVNTAIIGPNGAGKSTLLKLLARELYAQKGSVKIYGQDRWNVWELRKRMGLVSQDLQINYAPEATGFAVVLSGYYSSSDIFGHQNFSDEQIEKAKEISGQLGIEHLSKTFYSKMSTGEQRRHLLVRALVNEPQVLVLDEPTTGLDIQGQFHYLSVVRELMRSGKSLVLVTHHIHEIPPEVTEVALLNEGKVTFHGSKEEALSESKLSEVFQTDLKVITENGFYNVVPA